MKLNKLKVFITLIITVLVLGVVGCGKNTQTKENSNEPAINISSLLECKGFNAGDNSTVGKVISNLPASEYSEGFELQTKSKPYEITINYKDFNEVTYDFAEDGTFTVMDISDVIRKNAMIILSLSKNAEIVNFKFDDGTTISYDKSDLINAYKSTCGDNLEKITKDSLSLENFIKNDLRF